MAWKRSILVAGLVVLGGRSGVAQYPPGQQGSANIEVMSHVPLGRMFTVGDIEAEQELSRPYVYVPRMQGTTASTGFTR